MIDLTVVALILLLWVFFGLFYAIAVFDNPTRRITRRRYYFDIFICWPGILIVMLVEKLGG